MSFRPAVFDCDILAFDIARFCKTFGEGGDERTKILRRRLMKKAHDGFRHPLRLRRKRPRSSRAADKRDELTSLDVEHGDFLPYALSAPPTGPVRSILRTPTCRRAAGKSLGQT